MMVSSWTSAELGLARDQVLDVYADAMGVSTDVAQGRRSILSSHLRRDGLCTVAAEDDSRLVGVAYGYLGRSGQWWHDRVREAMAPALTGDWLADSFEVCELHVRPSYQGRGIGRQLLDALLTETSAATAVLTTPEGETRARGFYRAAGWVDLVTGLRFAGDPRAFAVLGLRLPVTVRTPGG